MYLITGMPRSGTTFMAKVFEYFGHVMKNPCVSQCGYPKKKEMNTLSEPRSISMACANGMPHKHFKQILKQIEAENQKVKKTDADILVMKSPQLIFFFDVLKIYEKVIVCYRKPEGKWIQSMKNHNGIGWINSKAAFLKGKNTRTIKEVGEVWYDQCQKMIKELNKVVAFELGNETSERKCLSEFLEPIHVDQAINEMLWNKKSRPTPLPLKKPH